MFFLHFVFLFFCRRWCPVILFFLFFVAAGGRLFFLFSSPLVAGYLFLVRPRWWPDIFSFAACGGVACARLFVLVLRRLSPVVVGACLSCFVSVRQWWPAIFFLFSRRWWPFILFLFVLAGGRLSLLLFRPRWWPVIFLCRRCWWLAVLLFSLPPVAGVRLSSLCPVFSLVMYFCLAFTSETFFSPN